MNDKALYQLERAVDALKLMAEALREEQEPKTSITFNDYNCVGGYVYPSAWSDDVISFGGDTVVNSNTDVITFS